MNKVFKFVVSLFAASVLITSPVSGVVNSVNAVTNFGLDSQIIAYDNNTPIFLMPYEMLRLYNPNSGEHFYTSNASEKNNLVAEGWRYEGTAWNSPASGIPVHRMYNPYVGDHHYTTSDSERDFLVDVGWIYEGVGWYSSSSTTNPIYRLYNPYCTGAGSHHYTSSESERDFLQSVGWRYEGIGWYGA